MQQPDHGLRPLTGIVRHLRHSELRQFEAHLLRLDSESRRDRFNGPTNGDFVSAYAARSFHDGTIVIGYVEDGQVLGAAELHERAEPDVGAAPPAEVRAMGVRPVPDQGAEGSEQKGQGDHGGEGGSESGHLVGESDRREKWLTAGLTR